MATTFHELTVGAVDPLTDDSAAVTFEVPDDLRELFDFAPGEALTLRRVVDGVEQRRTYSICAPAGSSGEALQDEAILVGEAALPQARRRRRPDLQALDAPPVFAGLAFAQVHGNELRRVAAFVGDRQVGTER